MSSTRLSFTLPEIRNGTGFERDARFVTELSFDEVSAKVATLERTIDALNEDRYALRASLVGLDDAYARNGELQLRCNLLAHSLREIYSTLYAADAPNYHGPFYRDAISHARDQVSMALAKVDGVE
jgi:hypothetical protein